jgi:mannitol/fructose-specific phosphotransferase system IIA component (Ntr-type)
MVLTAVEQYYANVPQPNVIVVCNSGTITANFLTEKLRHTLAVTIQGTVPLRRLEDAKRRYPCDLIISTIPLSGGDIPLVHVSPVLTNEDMHRVQSAIRCVKEWNARTFSKGTRPCRSFTSCLVPEHLAVDVQVKNWREAVSAAGVLLLKSGCITREYIDNMIRTVEEHGPYIVFIPGIALAHATAPDCVNDCASLIKLREPVRFGHEQNDPVRVVMAVQTPGTTEHLQALFHAMNMMCDEQFAIALHKACSVMDLHHVIESYELEHCVG